MTAETLGNLLVRHGVIDIAAITDPEGYDAGVTLKRVGDAAQEITAMEKTHEQGKDQREGVEDGGREGAAGHGCACRRGGASEPEGVSAGVAGAVGGVGAKQVTVQSDFCQKCDSIPCICAEQVMP